jgi:hypothetical protein
VLLLLQLLKTAQLEELPTCQHHAAVLPPVPTCSCCWGCGCCKFDFSAVRTSTAILGL